MKSSSVLSPDHKRGPVAITLHDLSRLTMAIRDAKDLGWTAKDYANSLAIGDPRCDNTEHAFRHAESAASSARTALRILEDHGLTFRA